jgi:hypothetical protein
MALDLTLDPLHLSIAVDAVCHYDGSLPCHRCSHPYISTAHILLVVTRLPPFTLYLVPRQYTANLRSLLARINPHHLVASNASMFYRFVVDLQIFSEASKIIRRPSSAKSERVDGFIECARQHWDG